MKSEFRFKDDGSAQKSYRDSSSPQCLALRVCVLILQCRAHVKTVIDLVV